MNRLYDVIISLLIILNKFNIEKNNRRLIMNNGNELPLTMDEDFLDNFHLIVSKEKNNRKLKFFCPIIDSNSINCDNLITSLRDAAGHYCLSRSTWNEYQRKPMQLSHLVREKFRGLNLNEGELGELLLFSFLETDLKAPKLLTKMELKTNPNMYFNGADGVHYLKLSNGNYQLIFGESKAYLDLSKGISAALDSIEKFKNNSIKDDESGEVRGITFEKGLLNACIAKEGYSIEDKNLLKSLIYPKSSNSFDVDTAFAVFVLYNIDINDKDKTRSHSEFREWLFNDIKAKILKMMPRIFEKIEKRKLTGHAFYFYIVPFEDMENTKKKVLKGVME